MNDARQEWKLSDDEWLPYHPSASHIEPAYRDGWNRAYKMALALSADASAHPLYTEGEMKTAENIREAVKTVERIRAQDASATPVAWQEEQKTITCVHGYAYPCPICHDSDRAPAAEKGELAAEQAAHDALVMRNDALILAEERKLGGNATEVSPLQRRAFRYGFAAAQASQPADKRDAERQK
jgi:hypothetical protein